jgi:hypothetical protein
LTEATPDARHDTLGEGGAAGAAQGDLHEGSAPPAAAHCQCGYTRVHLMVSPERKYTWWGTFWVIFMGVSTTPIRVEFRCRVCGDTFDATEDPEDLSAFM